MGERTDEIPLKDKWAEKKQIKVLIKGLSKWIRACNMLIPIPCFHLLPFHTTVPVSQLGKYSSKVRCCILTMFRNPYCESSFYSDVHLRRKSQN